MATTLAHDRSTYEEAEAMGLTIDPRRHFVLEDDPWIDALRERTGNDRLFIYVHLIERKYVLCAWMYTPDECGHTGICAEIEVLDRHPSYGGISIEVAAKLLVSTEDALAEAVEAKRSKRRNRINTLESSRDETASRLKYMRSRGLNESANLVARGVTPMATQADVSEEEWDRMDDVIANIVRRTGGRKSFLVNGTRGVSGGLS